MSRILTTTAVLLTAVLVAACASAPERVRYTDPAPGFVLADVHVFSGETTTRSEDRYDLWVREGRIESLHPAGSVTAPAGWVTHPLSGKTVLPGLIDAHVHLAGTPAPPWALTLPKPAETLQHMLWTGLTTVIDVGGELKPLRKWHDNLDSGRWVGPELVYAGSPFAHPEGHPSAMLRAMLPWPLSSLAARRVSQAPGSVTEMVHAVQALQAGGARYAKLMVDSIPLDVPQLSDAELRRVVRGAQAAELPVLAHVGGNAEAMRALAAGVDIFVHNVYREALTQAVVDGLRAAEIPVVATIGVWDAVADLAAEGPPLLPFEAALMPPEWRVAVRTRPERFDIEAFGEWLPLIEATRNARLANALRLHEAGVTVLAGSDSPNVGWPAGIALHHELLRLHAAGLSPGAVLRAATAANADAFGLADRGRIAPGLRADLLVVDGDPSADLAALQQIRLVVRGGMPVERLDVDGRPLGVEP